jgi:hypothetical protein
MILVRRRPEEGESGEIWCASYRRKSLEYKDSIKTRCGNYIIFCWGIKRSKKVTCKDCIKAIKRNQPKQRGSV